MGLPEGWATDPVHGLTSHRQITALGNGVFPLQASVAITLGSSNGPRVTP